MKLCKTCGEEDQSNFYKQNWICKGCWNRMTYDRSRSKLDQLIDERGGQCERCGYNKCRSALCWHHKDPNEKEFVEVTPIQRVLPFIYPSSAYTTKLFV